MCALGSQQQQQQRSHRDRICIGLLLDVGRLCFGRARSFISLIYSSALGIYTHTHTDLRTQAHKYTLSTRIAHTYSSYCVAYVWLRDKYQHSRYTRCGCTHAHKNKPHTYAHIVTFVRRSQTHIYSCRHHTHPVVRLVF